MNNMNKTFAIIFFLAIGLSLFFVTGCKTTATNATNTLTTSRNEEMSLTLKETSKSIYQYDSYTIEYTLVGTDETVKFKSSNDSVVTVDEDGNVRGCDKGQATVSVSVAGIVKEMIFTVTDSPYSPKIEISSDNIAIEKGNSFTFTLFTSWNKEMVRDDVEYRATVDDDSMENISLGNIEDGLLTVTALKKKEGEAAKFHITATTRGLTTTKEIVVNIVNSVVSIEPSDHSILQVKGGYEISLATDDINGGLTNVPLTFVNSETGESVNVAWDLENTGFDSNVVKVEKQNDVFYAIANNANQTYLYGRYQEDGIEPVDISIKVNVIKPLVKLDDENKTIEIENLLPITIDASIKGTIQKIECNGKDVSGSAVGNTITLSKEDLPTRGSDLGSTILTITTDRVIYEYPVKIYTMLIRTKEDLNNFASVARTNGDFENTGIAEGYFALANNIEYNDTFVALTDSDEVYLLTRKIGGVWYDSAKFGFAGTFDGNGYNIQGLRVTNRVSKNASGGFLGCLNTRGVIKNVSFTEAIVEENSGFICSWGDGQIENIYVKYSSVGVGNPTTDFNDGESKNDPRRMGTFFTFMSGSSAFIKDCIVDCSSATTHYAFDGLRGKANTVLGTRIGNVANLIVICKDEDVLASSGGTFLLKSYDELVSNLKVQETLKTFDDVWKISNGIPFFKAYFDTLNAEQIAFTNPVTEVFSNTSILFDVNTKYSSIKIDGNVPEGVSLVGNLLTVGDVESSSQIKLVAKSYLDNSEATLTINIYPSIALSVDSGAMIETGSEVELDLTAIKDYLGTEVIVNYGANRIGSGTVSSNKISVDTTSIDEFETIVLKVISNKNGKYYSIDYSIRHITKMIKTVEDLKSLKVVDIKAIDGIYVLMNDIDCAGAAFDESVKYNGIAIYDTNYGFKGTFDGQGHTISNFIAGAYGLFGHVGKGAVIKNVTYDQVTYKKTYNGSLFGTVLDAVIENVTVNVKAYNNNGEKSQGLIGGRYLLRCTLTNVTVNAADATVHSVLGVRADANTYTNVKIAIYDYAVIGYFDDGGSRMITEEPDGLTIILS